jgi:hypothetical protein
MFLALTSDGAFKSKDAWHLLATVVRRIFSEIESAGARGQVAGGSLASDADRAYVPAVVLHATLKTHD